MTNLIPNYDKFNTKISSIYDKFNTYVDIKKSLSLLNIKKIAIM